MKLSTRGKYGLYAMYYLAEHQGEGPQSLQNIASVGIPKQYLEQLLGNLRRAGLVGSVRGAQGGYKIAKAPEKITILDVIDAMEGPLELSECMSNESTCDRSCQCPVRRVWRTLTDSINRELAGITLGDMLATDPIHTNARQ
ncbi:MAG: Rrf2 family transcriptional regulator [Eubacteriales bacterium]|nr:Rrf2 family transcriptional regulator [Eubacteriales bacterium]